MDYKKLLNSYDLRFDNNQDIVATFLVDIQNRKYISNIRNKNINEKEILNILQSAIRPFQYETVNNLIVETQDHRMVFVRIPELDSNHLLIAMAKRSLSLGALLSFMKDD